MKNLKKKAAWRSEYGDAFISAGLNRAQGEEASVVSNLLSHLRQLMNYVARVFKRVDWKRIIDSPPTGCPVAEIITLLEAVSKAGAKLTRTLVCRFVKLVVPALKWVRSLFQGDDVRSLTSKESQSLAQTEAELENCTRYLESWGDLMVSFVVGVAGRLLAPFRWLLAKMMEAVGKVGVLFGDMVVKVTSNLYVPEAVKVYAFQFLTLVAATPVKIVEFSQTYGADVVKAFSEYVATFMEYLWRFVDKLDELFSVKSYAASAKSFLRTVISSRAWKAFDYSARLVHESMTGVVRSLTAWMEGFMACGTYVTYRFLQDMALAVAKSYSASLGTLTDSMAAEALFSVRAEEIDGRLAADPNAVLYIDNTLEAVSVVELHSVQAYLSSLSYPRSGQKEELDAALKRYLDTTRAINSEAERRLEERKRLRLKRSNNSIVPLIAEDIGDTVKSSKYLAQRLFDTQWTKITGGGGGGGGNNSSAILSEEEERLLVDKYTLFTPEEQELVRLTKRVYIGDLVKVYRDIADLQIQEDTRVTRRRFPPLEGSSSGTTIIDVSSIGVKVSKSDVADVGDEGLRRRRLPKVVPVNSATAPKSKQVLARLEAIANRGSTVSKTTAEYGSDKTRANNAPEAVPERLSSLDESIERVPQDLSAGYASSDGGKVALLTAAAMTAAGAWAYTTNNANRLETDSDIFREFWRGSMDVDNWASEYSVTDPDEDMRILYDTIQASGVKDFAAQDPKIILANAGKYFSTMNKILKNLPSIDAMLSYLADPVHEGKNESIVNFITTMVNKDKPVEERKNPHTAALFVAGKYDMTISTFKYQPNTRQLIATELFTAELGSPQILGLPAGVDAGTPENRQIPQLPFHGGGGAIVPIDTSYGVNELHVLDVVGLGIEGGTPEVDTTPIPGGWWASVGFSSASDAETALATKIEKATVRKALETKYNDQLKVMNTNLRVANLDEKRAKRDASLQNNLAWLWSYITPFTTSVEGIVDIIAGMAKTISSVVVIALLFWVGVRILAAAAGVTDQSLAGVIQDLVNVVFGIPLNLVQDQASRLSTTAGTFLGVIGISGTLPLAAIGIGLAVALGAATFMGSIGSWASSALFWGTSKALGLS